MRQPAGLFKPLNLIFGRKLISASLNTKVFQADYFHIHTHSLFILPDAVFNKHRLTQDDTIPLLGTTQAKLNSDLIIIQTAPIAYLSQQLTGKANSVEHMHLSLHIRNLIKEQITGYLSGYIKISSHKHSYLHCVLSSISITVKINKYISSLISAV